MRHFFDDIGFVITSCCWDMTQLFLQHMTEQTRPPDTGHLLSLRHVLKRQIHRQHDNSTVKEFYTNSTVQVY